MLHMSRKGCRLSTRFIKPMKFLVKEVGFDFDNTDTEYRVKWDEQIEIERDAEGIYEATSEVDLFNQIQKQFGWTIQNINYTTNVFDGRNIHYQEF